MERIRKALLGGHPLIYVLTWEETRVERLAAAPGQDLLRVALPVRRLVGRRRARRRRRSGPGHAGPAAGPRSHPGRLREGLLPPEGLSDLARRPAGDRAAAARPLPGAQGPRPPRAARLAAACDPRGRQEGDLRRRVRAARRQRDLEDPRRAPAPAPLASTIDEPPMRRLVAGDARPDGGRDRPPVVQGLRAAQDASTRPASSRSWPRRSRCRARRACSSSCLRASRSRTSAATRC